MMVVDGKKGGGGRGETTTEVRGGVTRAGGSMPTRDGLTVMAATRGKNGRRSWLRQGGAPFLDGDARGQDSGVEQHGRLPMRGKRRTQRCLED